ncbi:type II toxin-antitoxin system RelE/ParE family toxin [Devosia ginsengisoli]|uniref:type II toxin-antitoxin system RelE/ParE family toxin n=1 Tax=Devosia ginsengisoli TaxID=400770 RepID=UPI0026EB07CA|nr:type II toxin-antitoxin system RelE/ParE family toxin [Devosia ginsengisoli]MCR6670280.1 type II toxin-antitoxin system RelE/ParE family toxin [Devosia ginsengisoli]
MKVRLSRNAADYVRQEAAYLRQHNRLAAERFLERVKSVRRDLASFAEAGFFDEALPVPGMRRFVRDGYFYDYRAGKDLIEIAAISSSVNRPLLTPSDDDDFDYEAPLSSDPDP